MEALRQSARSMYAYACFDLECLYHELAAMDRPRRETYQALSARAGNLVAEMSRNLRDEVLSAEDSGDPEIIAVADGFAKSIGNLCGGLLEPLLTAWCRGRPL